MAITLKFLTLSRQKNDPLVVNRIFVGGIPFEADEDQLRQFFQGYGPVIECKIIRDRDTGHSKGYAVCPAVANCPIAFSRMVTRPLLLLRILPPIVTFEPPSLINISPTLFHLAQSLNYLFSVA